MTEKTDWMRANRVPIRLDTYYAYGWVEGAGVVANISYSGALIEGTPAQPDIGTPIVLHVCLHPPRAFQMSSPFELVGHVTRHSASGFAVKYDTSVDQKVRRMVDNAAAIVATRN
jgi:hypothetical protein